MVTSARNKSAEAKSFIFGLVCASGKPDHEAGAAPKLDVVAIRCPLPGPCRGDSRLRKIGEDVTETLELVPRQWKVIQHVREKLVCRACEAITQPPAPRTRLRAGVQGPSSWPMSCSPSTACTCRSIVRAMSTSAKASTSTYRRWQIGWAPPRQP